MKPLSMKQLLIALSLSGSLMITGMIHAADTVSVKARLQQSEAALQKAARGDLSGDEVWSARKEHRALVLDVLQELNRRNIEVSSSGRSLTDEELLHSLRAMGRLLEELAADYPVKPEPYDHLNELPW